MPFADLHNPQQFRLAVQNISNLHDATPKQVRKANRYWYDRVNEATAKGVRGTSMSEWHGAGTVAAVSPSMDWDKRNIDAFGELHKLRQSHWDAIAASAAGGQKGRSQEAAHALHGMSISSATDSNLVKAHRIMQGEDPDVVLPRRTAPKTNAFAHNIHDPQTGGGLVTIDGRAHDIAINSMHRWRETRGIGSAGNKNGTPTRYEHFEHAYRSAAGLVGDIQPHQLQAITWEGGKQIEQAGLTKAGKPRQQGVFRVGQPYL